MNILYRLLASSILFPLFININAQTHIAIVDFSGKGVSEIEASALTDRLRIELFQTGEFKVIEREIMDQILKEQDFQLSGCTSTECIVEVGRLIGVERMVGGSISKVGDIYSVSARIISVETGEIITTAVYDHRGGIGDLLTFGMKNVANTLSGNTAVESVTLGDKPIVSKYGGGKSVRMAMGISIGPGFFIHGLGNLYVGNKKTALRLFLVQVATYTTGFVIDDFGNKVGTGAVLAIVGWFGTYIADIITSRNYIYKQRKNSQNNVDKSNLTPAAPDVR